MADVTITDPGNKSTKPQKFDVIGTADAVDGSRISCTISKGAFKETQIGLVTDAAWSIPLGGPNPIPVDTDYAISADLLSGTGGAAVEGIIVTDKPLIEITDIKIEVAAKDTEWLLVSCRVKEKPPFNALSCLVYVHGQKGPPTVVSTGWIKPIPDNLKYTFKLNAPAKGHRVVHVMGIKAAEDNTGEVVARVTKAVKK